MTELTPPTDLHELQAMAHAWAFDAFPADTSELRCLGVAEEAGELCRALLKRANGIRGTRAQWDDELRKEAADVVVTVAILAAYEDFDLFDAIVERFQHVRSRDLNHDSLDELAAGEVGPCPECDDGICSYSNPDDTRIACDTCAWEGFDDAILGPPIGEPPS